MSYEATLEFTPSSLFRSSYHFISTSGDAHDVNLKLYGLVNPCLCTLVSDVDNSLYAITESIDGHCTLILATASEVLQTLSYENALLACATTSPLTVLINNPDGTARAVVHEIQDREREAGSKPRLNARTHDLPGGAKKFARSMQGHYWLTPDGSLMRSPGSAGEGADPDILSSSCVDFSVSSNHLCVLRPRLLTLHALPGLALIDAAAVRDSARGASIIGGGGVEVEYRNGGMARWEPREGVGEGFKEGKTRDRESLSKSPEVRSFEPDKEVG